MEGHREDKNGKRAALRCGGHRHSMSILVGFSKAIAERH
jgi:hypothetical protein